MIKLSAKTRKEFGRKTRSLKESGRIPAIVYGRKIKNILLEVDQKDFSKVYSKAGESSLVELSVDGKEKKTVLIHDFQRDPVTDNFIHVDFFEISAKEEVEVKVPLVFEGVAPAIKDLGGNMVKNISELHVKALPQDLPHEIKVDISKLINFGDHILIKDIILPLNVKVSAKPEDIVVSATEPTKVEEELAKEIEEKVEDVEKVEKPKKEEEVVEETPEKK
jgi:large subunit ribosomal protein L25